MWDSFGKEEAGTYNLLQGFIEQFTDGWED